MGTAGVQRSASIPGVQVGAGKSAKGKRTWQTGKRALKSNPEPFVPVSPRVSSKSRISPKGQITLPMLVRERLGVRAGDEVEFFFDGEQTVMRPVRSKENPFTKWIGIAKAEPSFETDAWISEMRDDEERVADLEEIRRANGR